MAALKEVDIALLDGEQHGSVARFADGGNGSRQLAAETRRCGKASVAQHRRPPPRARPQVPGAIAEQRLNPRRWQALLDAVGGLDLAVFETLQAPIRAGPQRAIRRFRQRRDPARSERWHRREAASIEVGQSGIERAGPQIAVAVLKERSHVFAGHPLALGVACGSAVEELVQSVLGGHPQAAFAILANRKNGVLRKSFAISVALYGAVAQAAESIARADPDVPIPPWRERKNHVVGEPFARRIQVLPSILNADQTLGGADPDVPPHAQHRADDQIAAHSAQRDARK